MSFAHWIRKLAEDLHLPGAGTARSDVLELEFEGGVRCSMEASPDGQELFIASALAPLPPSDACEVLEQLLFANAPAATAGPVFAIDPQRDEVVLQQAFAPRSEADYEAFVTSIGQFVHEARQWKARLVDGRWPASPGDEGLDSEKAAGPGANFFVKV